MQLTLPKTTQDLVQAEFDAILAQLNDLDGKDMDLKTVLGHFEDIVKRIHTIDGILQLNPAYAAGTTHSVKKLLDGLEKELAQMKSQGVRPPAAKLAYVPSPLLKTSLFAGGFASIHKEQKQFMAIDPMNPKTPLYFQTQSNQGGGNCAFLALRITRDDLVNHLLKLATDPDARQSVSEEIYEAIISKDIPAKNFDGLVELLDTLEAKETAVDVERRKLRDRFPNAPKENDNTAGTRLNDWLLENNHFPEASRLSSLTKMATTAQTQVMNFLKTKPVYRYYIESLRKDGVWMGCDCACLYAKSKADIKLRVWEMQSSTELRLKKHQPSTNPRETLDILYQRGRHFLKLNLVPAPMLCDIPKANVEDFDEDSEIGFPSYFKQT